MQLSSGVTVTVVPPDRPATGVTPPTPAPAVLVVPVPGLRGPTGPAGTGGFVYVQSSPAATWTITHGLGRHPVGVLITVGTSQVDTDVEFPDLNTVVLTFAQPTTGRADLI